MGVARRQRHRHTGRPRGVGGVVTPYINRVVALEESDGCIAVSIRDRCRTLIAAYKNLSTNLTCTQHELRTEAHIDVLDIGWIDRSSNNRSTIPVIHNEHVVCHYRRQRYHQ